MRSETEIRELHDELAGIVDYVSDFGTEEESENEDMDFASDVLDTLDWIMEKISTKEFTRKPYLDMYKLKKTAETIKDRTGEAEEEEPNAEEQSS